MNIRVMHLTVLIAGILFQLALVSYGKCPEDCQPASTYGRYSPRIRHLYLKPTDLQKFEEILVIGDVHGCFDELQMLLKKANATSPSILKIFVGDLVRKGPKNLEVLNYVRNSESCLSVRGNNDEKCLIRLYSAQASGNYTLKRQDKWMVNLSPADLEYLEELPYTISIPSLNVIIVHAGFIPGIPMEKQHPWTMMNIRDIDPDQSCPGGYRPIVKKFAGHPWASKWKGPQHVYFGHDNKKKLQLYPFATGLDTSCFRGNYMTGLFISGFRAGAFVTQNALRPYHYDF
ncbi:metallophos domain-containing protein [Nephila pilipes]|uniref:Metallophos domain-containing protein n=1 Tax=Nephila pilipes TaxID=299642 RepID=A0A8X6PY54_NEPPI|nr:metallophos domain-containing protein [Nephila pilipes]GFU39562.1 metallophos domain-containing protein [Nephila pilipes]